MASVPEKLNFLFYLTLINLSLDGHMWLCYSIRKQVLRNSLFPFLYSLNLFLFLFLSFALFCFQVSAFLSTLCRTS